MSSAWTPESEPKNDCDCINIARMGIRGRSSLGWLVERGDERAPGVCLTAGGPECVGNCLLFRVGYLIEQRQNQAAILCALALGQSCAVTSAVITARAGERAAAPRLAPSERGFTVRTHDG